ncbi:MAG: ABC transporter permease [Clostridia bacterium]|nr:ABC transporter permease [Clostridia bacterium]
MTITATVVSYIIGLPLGIMLVITSPDGIHPVKPLNAAAGLVVNILRSIPFLILVVALIDFTRLIVGTFIGPTATIVPLTVAAAPFVARMVEASIKEVDPGVIEAAQSMGASTWAIITKVMLSEAKPSLINGAAVATITILGYSAMAGFVGGGGLGDIAIRYGYYKYDTQTMWLIVLIIVVVVQILQEIGIRTERKTDNRIA